MIDGNIAKSSIYRCTWSFLPAQVLLDESGKVPAPFLPSLVAFCFVLMSSMRGLLRGFGDASYAHSENIKNRSPDFSFVIQFEDTFHPSYRCWRSPGFDHFDPPLTPAWCWFFPPLELSGLFSATARRRLAPLVKRPPGAQRFLVDDQKAALFKGDKPGTSSFSVSCRLILEETKFFWCKLR